MTKKLQEKVLPFHPNSDEVYRYQEIFRLLVSIISEEDIHFFNAFLKSVANKAGLEIGAILSESRKVPVIEVRHVIMYFMTTRSAMSYAVIGQLLGGRDHSTVCHGLSAHSNQLFNKNPRYLQYIKELRVEFGSRPLCIRLVNQSLVDQEKELFGSIPNQLQQVTEVLYTREDLFLNLQIALKRVGVPNPDVIMATFEPVRIGDNQLKVV